MKSLDVVKLVSAQNLFCIIKEVLYPLFLFLPCAKETLSSPCYQSTTNVTVDYGITDVTVTWIITVIALHHA